MAPLLSFHVRALGEIFTLPNNMVEFADKNASKKAKGVETDGGTNDEEVLQYLIDDQLQRQDNQTASVMADVEDLDDALDITQLGVGDSLGVEGLPDAPNVNAGYIFTLTSSNTAPAPTDEGHEDWWATRCEEEIPLSSSTGPFLESEQDASTMVFKDRVLSEFGSSSISNSNASVRGEALEPKAAARTKEDMNSDEKLRAKRLKAQERREKNRLCAQRSNRRAKAIRDGLKTDLKMSKEKVEILRAKEMALRQVNLELRRAVTEHPN